MYDLGDKFKIDLSKLKSNPDCIFSGTNYRITVLTERLVRLEYSETGNFNDNLTEIVSNRNFPKPIFEKEENDNTLIIKTQYFELIYSKGKNFYGGKIDPSKNLKINLIGTEKKWYYTHPEVRNYKYASDKSLKKVINSKSLYSIDGFVSIDDSNTYDILPNGQISMRNNKSLDIYVFMYNKDFYYCLNDYFTLTGYPDLIPRYALGLLVTKNTYYDQYSLLKSIQKYEEHGIPISTYIIKNWESDKLYELNNNYKEIDKLSDYLNSKKIKLGLTLRDNKVLTPNTYNYDLLRQYLPIDTAGNIILDMFNPRIVDGYLKMIIHPLYLKKIKFFELESLHSERINNLIYYLYKDYATETRPFLISKNPLIVPHKYSILYSGESTVNWNSLEDISKFNRSASNMGISFWSHDFGGTKDGEEDSELYTRFIQFGTFSPILRLGSNGSKYYKREPWKWGMYTSQIASYYINLRYKLIPYIYTEYYKYYKFGKPIIEPIYYRYPELIDDTLYNDNYFFGSSFYVCPILHKKDFIMDRVIQKLYIPDGIWYDYFTGKKYNGNKRYVSFYKEDEYPVFVRSGAIIPLSIQNSNDTSIPNRMEFEIFPGSSNSYSIYEDDGETNNYKNGEFAITNIEFKYEKNNFTLTILPTKGKISILPQKRDYVIKFKNTKPTTIVKSFVDGKPIENKKIKNNTDLIIEVLNVSTSAQLTIVCTGQDIEFENIKIINEDIVSVISDLPIKTVVKDKVDKIMFSNELSIKKKRIEIRKLAHGKNYLEKKYIDLFLKLLEYINEV